jgi:3-methyl-2-oxobutanoate hydroxymethyltransferase
VQGKTAVAARALLADALALQEAGCFGVVLEAVPAVVAEAISRRLRIPTIGIGAGAGCDGQVLVFHDILGLYDRLQPRFVREYASLRQPIVEALGAYVADVQERRFPAAEHTYPMDSAEERTFLDSLNSD